MEQKICPVDVIAMCSASGEIRPLRVRMEDEEHQLMRVDIEEIVNIRQVQYVGIEATVYLCRATVRQKRWLFSAMQACSHAAAHWKRPRNCQLKIWRFIVT